MRVFYGSTRVSGTSGDRIKDLGCVKLALMPYYAEFLAVAALVRRAQLFLHHGPHSSLAMEQDFHLLSMLIQSIATLRMWSSLGRSKYFQSINMASISEVIMETVLAIVVMVNSCFRPQKGGSKINKNQLHITWA